MGIDTWAVDYVLLDEKDQVLGKTYGYRDGRTQGVDEDVYKIISEEELYSRTGIKKQSFNTIYQLMAVKKNNPEHLKAAKTFFFAGLFSFSAHRTEMFGVHQCNFDSADKCTDK